MLFGPGLLGFVWISTWRRFHQRARILTKSSRIHSHTSDPGDGERINQSSEHRASILSAVYYHCSSAHVKLPRVEGVLLKTFDSSVTYGFWGAESLALTEIIPGRLTGFTDKISGRHHSELPPPEGGNILRGPTLLVAIRLRSVSASEREVECFGGGDVLKKIYFKKLRVCMTISSWRFCDPDGDSRKVVSLLLLLQLNGRLKMFPW